MMNSFEQYTDIGIKSGVVLCNALAYILLEASPGNVSSFDAIEKGGVIALLLLVTFTLWKMVQSKDQAIKETNQKIVEIKDQQIQDLKDQLNRK